MKKRRLLISLISLSFVVVLVSTLCVFLYPKYGVYFSSMLKPIKHKEDDKLIVTSYNIRHIDNTEDKGYRNFKYRAPLIKKNLELINSDIIGFQEVKLSQYKYLKSILKEFDSEVMFRDEKKKTESCPIFYSSDLFEKIEGSSFYLSETPLVYSQSWGAEAVRLCTYVLLKEKSTNSEFVVANTHLDHVSKEARVNGLKVIINELNRRELDKYPTLLIGDFNAAYVDDENNYMQKIINEHLVDAAVVANPSIKSNATFNGYGSSLNGSRIDYILGSKTNIVFKNFNINTNLYTIGKEENQYPSDHFPISAEFLIK